MVALARQTLLHEWRRFLPAMIAVGFAGLLQLLQAALVLGIFGSASVYIKGSSADLWVGYPGTQSVNLGRPIDAGVEMHLRMEPQVRQVEPFLWVDGDWRGARDTGGVSVYVSGIDTGPQGLMFDRVLPAALRARLQEVDTVVVDRADLGSLGVAVGDTALINGHRVRVIGVTSGLRALGGVNVVASLSTARQIDLPSGRGERMTYLLAKLNDSAAGGRGRCPPARCHGVRPIRCMDCRRISPTARRCTGCSIPVPGPACCSWPASSFWSGR
ncbi:ABC transporter permease [Pseudomonas asplenii]|uniref:ABC transporter permease n=1 Tax=Pseudomonas asplenii TaxID=53407 RepID=UPI0002E2290B|nr:ABC transporter permease [Pseudomonas fuscovaginae]